MSKFILEIRLCDKDFCDGCDFLDWCMVTKIYSCNYMDKEIGLEMYRPNWCPLIKKEEYMKNETNKNM